MFNTIRLSNFARTGHTSQFGKLRDLGTLRLGADTAELVQREAHRLHVPPLEFLRCYIEQGFHGRSVIEREQSLRLDTIERLLPPSDQIGSR